MKKIIVFCLSLVLALVTCTGCQSTLKQAIDLQRYRDTVRNIDFGTMFTEENGYVFEGVAWGQSAGDFQDDFYSPITELYAEYGDGTKSYKADNFVYYYSGRKNSDALITFTAEGELYNISLIFSTEDRSSTSLTQSALYDAMVEAAKKVFGEPNIEINEKMEMNEDQTGVEKGVCWEYTLADGHVTSVEIASIFTTTLAEPEYISLDIVWKIPEE